jgi:hypothetical protein
MIATPFATPAGKRQTNLLQTTPPAHYVRVPQRLIAAAAYHPLQIGVSTLVARLFLVAQSPVPLSATDITRYDPSLSRGAAQRALSSLVDDGWLIASERTGQKTTYVPAWGRVNGAPLPWRIGALCLDRPRHVRAVCLDLRLLDLFLGKLTPQPQRAAVITRYVTSPLLAIADVGSYALLLGGLPSPTPSRRRLPARAQSYGSGYASCPCLAGPDRSAQLPGSIAACRVPLVARFILIKATVAR